MSDTAEPSGQPPAPGHVIVAGLGNVGFRVLELLRRIGRKAVVISAPSAREDWVRLARESGTTVLLGDARDAAMLEQARVDDASALIATTDQDVVNLETGLDVRRRRADMPVVMRIFDHNLASSLEAMLAKVRALGASALAGPALGAAALGEGVLGTFELDQSHMLIGRVTVEDGSPLVGLTRAQAKQRYGFGLLDRRDVRDEPLRAGEALILVAERSRFVSLPVRGARDRSKVSEATRGKARLGMWKTLRGIWSSSPRALRAAFCVLLGLIAVSVLVFQYFMNMSLTDAFYFIVTTVTTTGYGDISPKDAGVALKLYACVVMLLGSVTMAVLYSFATDFVVSERVRAAFGRMATTAADHVVVVGIGHVGYRTLSALEEQGIEVVAVDPDVNSEFAAAVRARCPFIAGDARQAATLRAAGIERARAIVAATGDDAINLAVGLAARRLAPEVRTVARLFDADFAQKVQSSGLVDVALSASRIAAPSFVAAALSPDAIAGFAADDALVMLRELRVPKAWWGRTPSELRFAEGIDVLLVAERRGAEPEPAVDAEPLVKGQRLLVAERVRYASGDA